MKSQKGVVHVLLLLFLAGGLIAGVYLVQNPTVLSPKARSINSRSVNAIPTPTPVPITACSADIDKNGIVDLVDFGKLRACFGQTITESSSADCKASDINKDNKVDLLDFGYIRQFFGQSCAAPTPMPSPTPSPTPVPSPTPAAYKRVFVTSTTYDGNLGGLAGADAKCQERSGAMNMGGTWKAWLSDSSGSPSTRFNRANVRYQRAFGNTPTNGLILANNWEDLTDGTLQNSILVTEFGTNFNAQVWTNTTPAGLLNFSAGTCQNWTTNIGTHPNYGSYGYSSAVDSNWTNANNSLIGCSVKFALYCFEQ